MSNTLVLALTLFTGMPCMANEEAIALLKDWEESSKSLVSKNFLSEGTLSEEIDSNFFRKYLQGNSIQNKMIIYKWKTIQLGNQFLIETSDNNFEWNPKISPDGDHLMFLFDGKYYTFLRSNKNSKPEYELYKSGAFKLRPPSGSIESQSYIQNNVESLVSPLDNNDLRSRKPPIFYKADSSRVDRIISGIQKAIPYPFSPYDLVSNPFFNPDVDIPNGNIFQYLLKHSEKLTTTNHGSYISLNVPISISTKTLWIPEKIFFKKINNRYTPFHFLGGNEYIKGSTRSIFRDVEIQNWITKNNIAIPSEIKIREFHNNDDGQLELAKIQVKVLDRIEIGESLTIREITPNIPTYAEMHKDGVWIKNTSIPDSPRPAWIYFMISLLGITIIVSFIKTIKRNKGKINA